MVKLDAPRYTVIVDPASMRWEHYQRDLLAYWKQQGKSPQIQVLSWLDVIAAEGDLTKLANADFNQPSLLRIESPARDFALFRMLMQAGEKSEGRQPTAWESPGGREGWIASPRLIYVGLSHVLGGIEKSIAQLPALIPTGNCRDILAMFDKNQTADILRKANLPTPDSFAASIGTSSQQVLERLRQTHWKDAYIKLAYGSCASGIAVVKAQYAYPHGVSTVVRLDGNFFNTYRVRQLSSEDLLDVLEFLIAEDVIVQQGIAKTSVHGQNFDVRVVVIRGQVAGCIFRVSPHPMTNLHLGGRRGDYEQVRRVIPTRQWLDGLDACVEAADLFDLPAVGVDLAFAHGDFSPFLLELNAFGDFFPNWKDAQGQSLHRLEIAATASKFGFDK